MEKEKENVCTSEGRERPRDIQAEGKSGQEERERRMQGGSVRGSVVAMGMIAREGRERVGRCKRTIKFYGSPELYLPALVCHL